MLNKQEQETLDNCPEGMKPFNLELALAGDEVICRDMQEKDSVTSLLLSGNMLEVVRNETLELHYLNGTYYREAQSGADLFMKPKTEKRWVAVNGNICTSYNYKTKVEMMEAEFSGCAGNFHGFQAIEITVEV